MRGEFAGRRLLRPEFSTGFHVDYAEFHRNHQIAVVAGAAVDVAVVVVRVVVVLYRHVKCFYQLLHPPDAGELRLLGMHRRRQNRQQAAENQHQCQQMLFHILPPCLFTDSRAAGRPADGNRRFIRCTFTNHVISTN